LVKFFNSQPQSRLELPFSSRLHISALSDNLIKNIDRRTSSELANLDSLYMFGNLIKELKVEVFSGLVNLTSLDLLRNFIRKFFEKTFKVSLRYLDIEDNPLDAFAI